MTIKEVADILGTTKSKIKGQLLRNCPTSFYSKINGIYDINEEGFLWFKERIEPVNHSDEPLNQTSEPVNRTTEPSESHNKSKEENTCKDNKSQVNHQVNREPLNQVDYEPQVNHNEPQSALVESLQNHIRTLENQISQKDTEINQLMQQVSDLQNSNKELASATAQALLQNQTLQYIESAKTSPEDENLRDPADAHAQNSDIAHKDLAKKKSFSRFNPIAILGIKRKR